MDGETPESAFSFTTLTIDCRITAKVPEFDSPICGGTSQEVSMGLVPRQRQNCINVVSIRGLTVFLLFTLLLSGSEGCGYMGSSFIGATEDHVGVHGLDGV